MDHRKIGCEVDGTDSVISGDGLRYQWFWLFSFHNHVFKTLTSDDLDCTLLPLVAFTFLTVTWSLMNMRFIVLSLFHKTLRHCHFLFIHTYLHYIVLSVSKILICSSERRFLINFSDYTSIGTEQSARAFSIVVCMWQEAMIQLHINKHINPPRGHAVA